MGVSVRRKKKEESVEIERDSIFSLGSIEFRPSIFTGP